MSISPNSKLVHRTIELNYTNKKRSRSFKWIVVNAVFLIIFVYDLSSKCPGYTSVLHYVELICAGVLAANLVQYALCLIPSRAPKLPLSPEQQKLLGISNTDLNSSFILTEGDRSCTTARESDGEGWSVSDAELSLSPRGWRRAEPPEPRPSPSPPAPPAPLDPARDHFIADRDTLADYLKRCSERSRPEEPRSAPSARVPPPLYQLAPLDTSGSKEESSPQGSPQVWWRLDLDPQRLTQWNLNLRLWIHITILERLVREVRAGDEALARLALCEAGALRDGRVSAARMRALAPHQPALAALAPYLEPFADRRYVLRRIAELARGGCMSEYKWDGGGADWEPSQPTDAELLLHLFSTYVEGQTGVAVAGGAASAGGAGEPRVVRLSARPPHYALALGAPPAETLAVGRGRNNLLHTLLLLLAAAARRDPPALARTHLGRAGLNMLWIIGR